MPYSLEGLSELQVALVQRVEREVDEIAAASLAQVLSEGDRAKRFKGITLEQLKKICKIAHEMQVPLPTKQLG